MDSLELLYTNLNQAVMLAARFAQLAGLPVGLGEDPLELDWPVLYITLPTGEQVSWRLPPDALVGEWPEYGQPHDGHTGAERRRRAAAYLRDAGLVVDGATFRLNQRAFAAAG